MPLRDFKCSACGLVQERFYRGDLIPPCDTEDCSGELKKEPLSAHRNNRISNVFPFTCPHVDGTGRHIEVTSMSQLRSLERKHNVVWTAFSQNDKISDIKF